MPRLVGIITHTDILSALIEMLGLDQPGTRIEVELPDASPGCISNALAAVGQCNVRIISMVVCDGLDGRRQRLYLRLSTIDPRPAIHALVEGGFRLADPFCKLV